MRDRSRPYEGPATAQAEVDAALTQDAQPFTHSANPPTYDREGHFDLLKKRQTFRDQAAPTSVRETFRFPGDRPVPLMILDDLHFGGEAVDHEALRICEDWCVQEPGFYVALHGDLIDNTTAGFPSAEAVHGQLEDPEYQVEWLKNFVKRMSAAQKLLWWAWGNHIAGRLEKILGWDAVYRIARPDDPNKHVPYFPAKGLVDLYVGQAHYRIIFNHKWPGNSYINPLHGEMRAVRMDFPDADVCLSGHTHNPAVTITTNKKSGTFPDEDGNWRENEVIFTRTGTFQGNSTYCARGWRRGIPGVPTIIFFPGVDADDKQMIWCKTPLHAKALLLGWEKMGRPNLEGWLKNANQ